MSYAKNLKKLITLIWVKEDNIHVRLLLSLVLVITSIVLNCLIPIVLKYIINQFAENQESIHASQLNIALLLASYGLIWMLSNVAIQMRQLLIIKPLERSIRTLSLRLFDHLHSLPVSFHYKKKTGVISSILTKAQDSIPPLFCGLFFFVLPIIAEILLAATLLSYLYGLIYGLILALIVAVFILFTVKFFPLVTKAQNIANHQHFEANSFLIDSLLNFISIKYFNSKGNESQLALKCLEKREKGLTNFLSYIEVIYLGQKLIIGCGLIIFTLLAGYYTVSKTNNISDFILINGYMVQFAVPLGLFGTIFQNIKRGLRDLENVFDLLDEVPAIQESTSTQSVTKFNIIEFKEVVFSYEEKNLILNNLSFQIKSGQTVAIVGSTGSGKSTISNLLLKLFDVTSGGIFFDGFNIKDIKLADIASMISIIPQDTMLFNRSIYENILFSRPNASKAEIMQAIKLAELDDCINSLPEHYNTIVGERGAKLSGGEKQRIIIARGLLKISPLYILDEATSSLDVKTEMKVIDNIKSSLMTKPGTTCLIITHRLTTITNVDNIIVLNQGKIIESGTHDELINKNGHYYKLWTQAIRYFDTASIVKAL
jgi:ABC-type transport system involved in Fe-S cluster assembly fused permease/ATPase subunit